MSTETEDFAAGDTIFIQGEPGDRLYVVRAGEHTFFALHVMRRLADRLRKGSAPAGRRRSV